MVLAADGLFLMPNLSGLEDNFILPPLVSSAFVLAMALAGTGGTLALAAATGDERYLVLGGAFLAGPATALASLPLYYSGEFFSTAITSARVLVTSSQMPLMLGGLFGAILPTMVLYDKLSFDNLKKPWEWTEADFQRQRLSGMATVLLISLPLMALIVSMTLSLRSTPFVPELAMLGFMGAAVAAMMIPMWRRKLTRQAAERAVDDSISGFIVKAHMYAAMGALVGLMLVMAYWALAYIGVALTVWMIYATDRFVRTELRDVVRSSLAITKKLEEEEVESLKELETLIEPKDVPKELLVKRILKEEQTLLGFFGGGMVAVGLLWSSGLHHPEFVSLSGRAADIVFLALGLIPLTYLLARGLWTLRKESLEDLLKMSSPSSVPFLGLVVPGVYTFALKADPVAMVLLLLLGTVEMLFVMAYYVPAFKAKVDALPGQTVNVEGMWVPVLENLAGPETETGKDAAADFGPASPDDGK
jgi:xanthosine utilization system XapX-like protein